jgi:hypothetical protein
MKSLDCPVKYLGQTGQTFYTRLKEHIQAVRNNNGNLWYPNHILKMGPTYGIRTNTMNVIKTAKKESINTFGKIPHIQNLQKQTAHNI